MYEDGLQARRPENNLRTKAAEPRCLVKALFPVLIAKSAQLKQAAVGPGCGETAAELQHPHIKRRLCFTRPL